MLELIFVKIKDPRKIAVVMEAVVAIGGNKSLEDIYTGRMSEGLSFSPR